VITVDDIMGTGPCLARPRSRVEATAYTYDADADRWDELLCMARLLDGGAS
jgi:hypothetical protein